MESLQSHCICTQSHTGPVGQPFASRLEGPGFNPHGGYLCQTGIFLLALSRYIGDPDMIYHCGLVWDGLRTELSLARRPDNVIIPHDLTQLFCPSFTLAAGPPFDFTTDIVSCWGGALWRACNLTAFIHSHTGPVGQPLLPVMRAPGSIPRGGDATHLCLAQMVYFPDVHTPLINTAAKLILRCSIFVESVVSPAVKNSGESRLSAVVICTGELYCNFPYLR